MKERSKELFLMITIWNVPNISTVMALLYILFRWGKYKWNWMRLYDERCNDVLFKLQDVIIANGLMLHSHNNNNTEKDPQPVRGHLPPIRRALSVSMFRCWPHWNWRDKQIGYFTYTFPLVSCFLNTQFLDAWSVGYSVIVLALHNLQGLPV